MPPNAPDQRPSLQDHRLWSGLSILSKRSLRSFTTSSFEADDERSFSDDDDDMSGPPSRDEPARSLPAPLYLGQDSRPTSRKELMGWYAYAFAAETYIICGIASFIPILLESLARENGVLLSDPSKSCGASDDKASGDGQCVVYVLGIQINTASFAMYTFSISVLLQAILVVSISCAADHGNYRKKLLLMFAWVGSASVMAYIFISKETYVLGALLTIISNTSFGASFVLLNSFLPLLVRNHPEVIAARRTVTPDLGASDLESRPLEDSGFLSQDSDSNPANSTSQLLSQDRVSNGFRHSTSSRIATTHEDLTSKELQLSTQISAKGIGVGYSAGLFVQCLGIGILILLNNTTWSQRVALFVVGLWWTVFTIPAAMWLRPRPGPPLADHGRGRLAWLQYIIFAWKSLFKTVMVARRLLDVMLFLASWFLLSDAIATTSSTAILFAKTTLHMKPAALAMISVISTTFGVAGAFGWSFISRAFSLKPHQTILVCIGIFELIPLYGLLGYLPFVQNWGVGGLQQPWEMYPLAAMYGLVLGGLSSYCRSLYGELIPPGSEAAFYALYAITDKGSSVFGPAIVAAIIDRTGNIRPAFWFLAVLVGAPAPIIWFVNVERGKREGEKLAGGVGVEVTHDTSDAQYERETRGMLADYD